MKIISKYKIWFGVLVVICLILFVPVFWLEKELKIRAPEVFLVQPHRPADIIVNTDRSFGPMPRVWRALAQGGEEGAGVRMLEPTVDLVKKLGVDYIRLDHIFDDDYFGVMKGEEKYDWSKLDQTVDDILAIGAKPFLSLSYLPEKIGPGKIGVPNNWQDWSDLVRATVEHYSSDIEGVYYEVWNEPPLEHFGSWKMYGEKDYRQLYKYAALGAIQAQGVKPFKIGGPSIPDMSEVWIRLLFDFCLANNLRLDFISWHRYSLYPEVFMSDVYQVNILTGMPKYNKFSKIEKVVTEWGPTPEKDTVYSSNVAASHALTVIRSMLDKLGWLFAFEVKDGPNQGEDAWGLLTHQLVEGGIKEKPRYFLFDWLAEMEGERLEVLGEGTQVRGFASKKDRTVSLILSNYQAQGGMNESFNVTFGSLAAGKYRLFEQELFQKPREREIEVGGDGSFVLNTSLPQYSVMRIRVTKLQ